jgi:outer membrane receptor protein involved in Fe transport
MLQKVNSYIAISLLIVFCTFHNTYLKAQEDSLTVEEIYSMSLDDLLKIQVTVSSTKSLSVFNTPSTVSIIDHEMIEEYGFLSIPEAISSVAGIDVMQTIIDKNVTTSRGILQNFYANKVLIMINNIPTWQPIYGDGQLERININDVEQIEILKGPASVLYGSNAYSGVVNIKLKNTEKTRVEANAYAGYPEIGGASVNFILKQKDLSLMIGAGIWAESRKPYDFEGVSTITQLYNGDSVFTYNENYDVNSFTLNLGYKAHNLLINNFRFYHSYLGASPSYVSGGGLTVENEGILCSYGYKKQIAEKFYLKGNFTFDYFQRQFPLSYDKQTMIHLAGYRNSGEIKLNYDILEKLKLEIGTSLDYRVSNGHDTRDGISDTLIRHNLIDDHPVAEWSVFSQLNYNYKWLNIHAGTRYTKNEYFGSNVSSRVSGMINLAEKQSIKLIFGQSFRVPTMFELYFNHPTVVGNMNLKPETSESYEVAYLIGFKKIYLQALWYFAHYNNLIQRIPGEPNTYQNVSSFDGYGIETEFRYQNPDFVNTFVSYNYLAGIDEEIDNNYRYVPDHTISFGLSKNLQSFAFSLNGRYISEVEGHLDIIPSQFNLDAQIIFKHRIKNAKIRHALIVRNITNSKMLTPEYIRQTNNINSIATSGFGTRFIYKLNLNF